MTLCAAGACMRTRNLKYLFEPSSVAVIGAGTGGRGETLMRNLLTSGFHGPVMPVSQEHPAIAGVLAYPDITSLPLVPQLAVIADCPETLPETLDQLGSRGTRAAVVIGRLPSSADGAEPLRNRILQAARSHDLRLLGADSLGVLVPGKGLNASISHIPALPGRVALVTQSGALASVALDWAHARGLGFSHVVVMGEATDVGFADLLDYLASDFGTSAILLCIEAISKRGNFVAAARAAARNKPVVAMKTGREPDHGRTDAATYAAALVQPDDVFDAVLRRAGILRVDDMEELFAAVRTLSRGLQTGSGRLAILGNGSGIAAMAADTLRAAGLQPATLSGESITRLNKIRRVTAAPGAASAIIDLGMDGEKSRHGHAVKTLLEAPEVDTTLVIHAPSAHENSGDIAGELITAAGRSGKRRLLAAWAGEASVAGARKLLAEAGIASYDTPGAAVKAFVHLVNHRRNRDMLMQTPPLLPEDTRPEVETARQVINACRSAGALAEPEAMKVLAAYGIPTVQWHTAGNPEQAERLSETLGYPIALTLRSPDIARIRDVGGIALYLESAEAVRTAAMHMVERARAAQPQARIDGFVLRRMVPRPRARQLFLGVATDPLFGPVIVVGEGGRAVEAYREHAVGLPPLNLPLARDLLSRTRAWHTLHSSPARPDANVDAICLAMVNLSQLVVDFPEITEVDINPFFADDHGVTVASAHMRLTAPDQRTSLSIRPYPKALEEAVTLRDGREVLVRPMRPEDEPLLGTFFSGLSSDDLFTRFFREVKELGQSELARMTQIDYEREMAFIAVQEGENGEEALGEVRTVTDPDNTRAEFAVTVRSDLKGTGLGRLLMEKMIRYCRGRGTGVLHGQVLARNCSMLRLARQLGMSEEAGDDPETVTVVLDLQASRT